MNDNNCGWTYVPNINQYIFDDFVNCDSEMYLMIEQRCIITKTTTVTKLLNIMEKHNYNIVSPMLVKNHCKFSNFWGDIDDSGFYKRSHDYYNLVTYVNRGIFNVPYVSGILLINRSTLKNFPIKLTNTFDNDVDMELAKFFRDNCLFVYMVNYDNYGYLL